MKWFRLYSDALNNEKIQALPPTLFKIWVNLLCLANDHEIRGTLPSIKRISFALRVSEKRGAEYVQALVERGLLEPTEGGGFVPHEWEKYQPASDNAAARMANARRVKVEHPPNDGRTSSEQVLPRLDKTRSDQIREEEIAREDAAPDPPSHPFAFAYAQNYKRHHSRPVSSTEHSRTLALEKEYGAERCIRVAEELDWAKPPAYMAKILEDENDKPNETNGRLRPGRNQERGAIDDAGHARNEQYLADKDKRLADEKAGISEV
jgi:hypothetical protein